MKSAKIIIEEYLAVADQSKRISHSFCLKDGTHYQGWIFEIEGDMVWFWDSGPFMDLDEDIPIPIDDIDLDSLTYWDEDKKRPVKFEPNP